MPVRSRRVAAISLAFDMLEERSLLSHWPMLAPPDWGFPNGHPGPPPPALAFPHDRPPAPFDSGPGVFSSQPRSSAPSVETSPAAPTSASVGATNSGAPSGPLAQPALSRTPPSDQGPDGPAGDTGGADVIATTSASLFQLAQSTTAARPIGTTLGTTAAGLSSLARLVPVTLGLIVPDVLFARAWVSQPGPLFRDTEAGPPPNAAAGNSDAPSGARPGSTWNLPNPRGAGPITDFAAIRQMPVGECLNRLLAGLTASERPVMQNTRIHPYVLTIALTLAALEAVRRWRRSATRTSSQNRRMRDSMLIGISRATR
jgi:hypothetical protein